MRDALSRRTLLLGGAGLAGAAVLSGIFGGTAWAFPSPPILSCDEWGARANRDIVNVVPKRPVKIIVHHTATPNVPDLGRPAAELLARAIQNFHMHARGWLDSGQHFTISRGGWILEGRRRSLEALRRGDVMVEGAHCTGQNLVAIGIENEGTYLDIEPPGALWDRLREMCAYVCHQYGIAPTEIYGHRDFKDTACPGDRLYGELPRLRGEVAAALDAPVERTETVKASWPLLRIGDRGAAVLAAQYLLRAAGVPGVEASGRYDVSLAATVEGLQRARGAEEITGMIGGETWPIIARPVRRGEGGAAERAVEVLAAERGVESLPDVVTPPVWQRLLGTGGAPPAA